MASDTNGNGKVTWGMVARVSTAVAAALALSLTAWRIYDGTCSEQRDKDASQDAIINRQSEAIARQDEALRYIHNRLDEIGSDVKELLRAERNR